MVVGQDMKCPFAGLSVSEFGSDSLSLIPVLIPVAPLVGLGAVAREGVTRARLVGHPSSASVTADARASLSLGG